MMRHAFLIICVFIAIAAKAQRITVSKIFVGGRVNPIGVDVANPVFNWQLESNEHSVLQTAFQILVASSVELINKNVGDIWDSKKNITSSSIQVPYKGRSLFSAKKYFWKVRVWDNKGNVSTWSQVGFWQMGLLQASDWNGAKWIGYEEINDSSKIVPLIHLNGKKSWGQRKDILPLFRKQFSINKKVKQATVFICGLGQFELNINGNKVGDHFLDPGWTQYTKQALYVTFDITNSLIQGNNAVGVMLGNGFYYIPSERYRKMTGAYGFPKMIATLKITYDDETTATIVSDETWKTTSSPVTFSSIYGGEDYDANLFQKGWDQPDFLGSNWKPAIVTTGPAQLRSQMYEPVKIVQAFPSLSQRELKKGVTLYDLGQNFSGIPSISLKGNKGDTVKLICGELINEDGTVNQKATGSPSFFTYILQGEGVESWHPLFTYTGFRYVEVHCKSGSSNPSLPQVTKLEGLHIRNTAKNVGAFICSNTLFNRIHELIDWAIKSNMVSVFTDCPHREKLGWLEQNYLVGPSVHYRYDVAALNRKVIEDMKEAQYANGKIPEIAPEFTLFTPPFDDSPEWGSAAIIYSWYNYLWYGDKEILRQSYEMMKSYVLYLKSKSNNNILSYGLGDWFDIGPNKSGFSQMTKMGVTATATFYYDLSIMNKIADLFGKRDDQLFYQNLATDVRAAFNKTFFDPVKMQYDSMSQTANAMALYLGLVEDKNRQAVVDALVKDIRSRNNALTAGDIGYRYVIKALEQAGRSDVIYDMNYRDDVPGYGFQLKHGATALTESWQAYESVSNNHFMLGHLMEWFYTSVAGIKQDENSIAYKKIIIEPVPVGDIKNADASFESPYGIISSKWSRGANGFQLVVQVPVNTTASIYLPITTYNSIYMNSKKIKPLRLSGKTAITVGSGKYYFNIKSK